MISLRRAFSRKGDVGASSKKGPFTPRGHKLNEGRLIYRCSETVSLRDVIERHTPQDDAKSNTSSVRSWIQQHCDPDSTETIITETPHCNFIVSWKAVENEQSRVLGGFQRYSRVTHTDRPSRHETRDWNWDVVPSPQYTYMLTGPMTDQGKDNPTDPKIHNEWESGSMPLEWRPFEGEYVTQWGRHIFDVAHTPVDTEIHPAHSIVREHTGAAPIGTSGEWVPVNRAIIGMGLCGGFPGGEGSPRRWGQEFGSDIEARIAQFLFKSVWPTNLREHPLRTKLFPPVPQPHPDADLKVRTKRAEWIVADDWKEAAHFLQLCRKSSPAKGGRHLAFRRWSQAEGLPQGFTPEKAPSSAKPTFTDPRDTCYDMEVDLSNVNGVPLGYYAVVECGWSRRSKNRKIFQFDVEFDRLKVTDVDDPKWDDWHLYYGVNGQWGAWYTSNFVEKGATYDIGDNFRVHTVDDQPLLIRDCGVEWEGRDFANTSLHRVEFDAPGPDHFQHFTRRRGVHPSGSGNTRSLRLVALEADEYVGADGHEWHLNVTRKAL
jgi:hypothetical protein